MVSSKIVSLAFLLVSFGVMLVVTPAQVNAEQECDCNEQNAKNGTDTESGGISDFFHKVKCGLKHGAKQATDAAKDGYRFVKNKIFTDSTEAPNSADPAIDVRLGNTEAPIKLAPLE